MLPLTVVRVMHVRGQTILQLGRLMGHDEQLRRANIPGRDRLRLPAGCGGACGARGLVDGVAPAARDESPATRTDHGSARSMKSFAYPRPGVDEVWPGKGVIYSQRLTAQRTKSRLGKIVGTPAYRSMTIRSWATTTVLLERMEAPEVDA